MYKFLRARRSTILSELRETCSDVKWLIVGWSNWQRYARWCGIICLGDDSSETESSECHIHERNVQQRKRDPSPNGAVNKKILKFLAEKMNLSGMERCAGNLRMPRFSVERTNFSRRELPRAIRIVWSRNFFPYAVNFEIRSGSSISYPLSS